ncbi:FHA domain-containing protein [Microlunatus speluncae]|uniref:FHA domain-containing protein n=1 Tax=Microlunatus speluncae TaxID=2594267 RepID=UPI00126644F1|nr:FHA domain-containing protein [Microlunatus speluncae]
MTVTCPDGHVSTADDYCDVCGAPITGTAAPAAAPPAPAGGASASPGPGQSVDPSGPATEVTCPNCSVPNPAEALFCEACGYDFTTGTMPRTVEAGDPADAAGDGAAGTAGGSQLFDFDTATDLGAVSATGPGADEAPFDWVAEVWIDPDWYAAQQSPDPLPSAGPPEIVPLRATSILVGRTSRSRNIHPDLACESDTGVSRRQAQLTTDGVRWWVEDLDSSNGTFIGSASGPLPEQPIPVGPRHELDLDDRIYLGAWTRIVIREATDDERTP